MVFAVDCACEKTDDLQSRVQISLDNTKVCQIVKEIYIFCAWDVNGHLRPTSLAEVAARLRSLACNVQNMSIHSCSQ